MSLYSRRGVSAQKEEVHKAVEKLDQGLFPNAFCKLYPDYLGADDNFINVMHADGAGTKSILAYMYWRETGDISVWKGIAQDAVAMNLDDLLCVGIHDNIIFNSTIDRNKKLIPGEVLEAIINGTQELFDTLQQYGVNIKYLGGETADVGDVVRTVAVNGTMACRWPKDKLISNDKIAAGQVIVGLASFGKSAYESEYNSGLGSNGLTSARHDVLGKGYKSAFPESFDNSIPDEVAYIGNNSLTDTVSYDDLPSPTTVGRLLLSPTRTFAPVMRELLSNHFNSIKGLIHCSGGGQTKVLKYLPSALKIIKDNLFAPPPIFRLIRENSGSANREMYEVFNMGCRMEIFCEPQHAQAIIQVAESFGVESRIIGRVEDATKKTLLIKLPQEELEY